MQPLTIVPVRPKLRLAAHRQPQAWSRWIQLLDLDNVPRRMALLLNVQRLIVQAASLGGKRVPSRGQAGAGRLDSGKARGGLA